MSIKYPYARNKVCLPFYQAYFNITSNQIKETFYGYTCISKLSYGIEPTQFKIRKIRKNPKGRNFFCWHEGKRKNPKIHKKPKGYDFLLAQKVKAKTIKKK